MSDICVPPDTDWSCRFTEVELAERKSTPEGLALIEKAEAFAWSLLAAMTNYQIGTCPVTVRPCAARCAPPGSYRAAIASGASSAALPRGVIGMLNPYISGGRWLNACGCGPSDCGCERLSEVILPGPVGKIVSVMLDGEEMPRTSYRVDNSNHLVRLDGEDWPACQDMTTDGDTAGFSVTYYRGAAPNIMTRAAAGVLANEFLLSCEDDESCRLPSNVTRASRGGESYDFQPMDFQGSDMSIPEVAAVLRIYNPNGLRSPIVVASPESIGVRQTTWARR